MKKFFGVLAAMLLIFGFAGVAGAIPMTWTDMIDWKPDKKIGWWASYNYDHDISDNGYGGIGAGHIVTRYSLTVELYDDGGFLDFGEVALINQPGLFGDGLYNFAYTSNTYGWSLAGLVDISLDGILSISIDSLGGDFYLAKSTLVVEGYSAPVPTPEPATILLMGTGLLALMGYSRKRFSKRS